MIEAIMLEPVDWERVNQWLAEHDIDPVAVTESEICQALNELGYGKFTQIRT